MGFTYIIVKQLPKYVIPLCGAYIAEHIKHNIVESGGLTAVVFVCISEENCLYAPLNKDNGFVKVSTI